MQTRCIEVKLQGVPGICCFIFLLFRNQWKSVAAQMNQIFSSTVSLAYKKLSMNVKFK